MGDFGALDECDDFVRSQTEVIRMVNPKQSRLAFDRPVTLFEFTRPGQPENFVRLLTPSFGGIGADRDDLVGIQLGQGDLPGDR